MTCDMINNLHRKTDSFTLAVWSST